MLKWYNKNIATIYVLEFKQIDRTNIENTIAPKNAPLYKNRNLKCINVKTDKILLSNFAKSKKSCIFEPD